MSTDTPPSLSTSQESLKLEVNGDSVGLDQLGPIIINEDGTMRRITNWHLLTDREKESSWQRISKRNEKRVDALKEKEGKEREFLDGSEREVKTGDGEEIEEGKKGEVLLLPEEPSYDSSREGDTEGVTDEEKGRTTTRSMF